MSRRRAASSSGTAAEQELVLCLLVAASWQERRRSGRKQRAAHRKAIVFHFIGEIEHRRHAIEQIDVQTPPTFWCRRVWKGIWVPFLSAEN